MASSLVFKVNPATTSSLIGKVLTSLPGIVLQIQQLEGKSEADQKVAIMTAVLNDIPDPDEKDFIAFILPPLLDKALHLLADKAFVDQEEQACEQACCSCLPTSKKVPSKG